MNAPSMKQQIATAFVAVLREWLTDEEFREMRARNAVETESDVCHSQDFCDANMAMDEAFRRCGLTADVEDGRVTALWNAAWDAAMPELTAKRRSKR